LKSVGSKGDGERLTRVGLKDTNIFLHQTKDL